MTKANPYSSVTVSGYNSSPPADDGTNVDANKVEWDKHVTKLGDPVKTAVESVNSNALSAIGQLKCQGRVTKTIAPFDLIPSTDSGCATFVATSTATEAPDTYFNAFDPSTRERGGFIWTPPKAWDQGDIDFRVGWSSTHATASESVEWGLRGIAFGDGAAVSATFATTEVTVTDPAQQTSDLMLWTGEATGLTVVNATATDIHAVFWELYRDATATGDDSTQDARFMELKIFYTEDKREDS